MDLFLVEGFSRYFVGKNRAFIMRTDYAIFTHRWHRGLLQRKVLLPTTFICKTLIYRVP